MFAYVGVHVRVCVESWRQVHKMCALIMCGREKGLASRFRKNGLIGIYFFNNHANSKI